MYFDVVRLKRVIDDLSSNLTIATMDMLGTLRNSLRAGNSHERFTV